MSAGIGIAFGGGKEALPHLVDTPMELEWAKALYDLKTKQRSK